MAARGDSIKTQMDSSHKRQIPIDLCSQLMHVTLRQLRAFVALARTGSFTLAAESRFVTQSALSGLIRELAQALLFCLHPQGALATPCGKQHHGLFVPLRRRP